MSASSNVEPIHLNFSDLFPAQFWVGLTLAFPYQIDPSRLQQALQRVLQSWPSLGKRQASIGWLACKLLLVKYLQD